jgi:hypothetical protein
MRAFALQSILALAAVLAGPGRAAAIEPMPLPAFQVSTPDGRLVSSADLVSDSQWVMLYVQARCEPCASLLSLASKDDLRSAAPHIVIIVGGGSADDFKTLEAQYPELASAGWYRDPDKKAGATLKLTGTPTIVGVRQSMIQWCFNGLLRDSDKIKSLLSSWLAG